MFGSAAISGVRERLASAPVRSPSSICVTPRRSLASMFSGSAAVQTRSVATASGSRPSQSSDSATLTRVAMSPGRTASAALRQASAASKRLPLW